MNKWKIVVCFAVVIFFLGGTTGCLPESFKTEKKNETSVSDKNETKNKTEHLEVANLFYELDVSGYDSYSMYTGKNKYVLKDDTLVLEMDFSNYCFVSNADREEIAVDIEQFVDKCLATGHLYGSSGGEKVYREELKDYSIIPLNETSVFCIQSVTLVYDEVGEEWEIYDTWKDEGVEWNKYVEWKDCNITGVLLKKVNFTESEAENILGELPENQ